MVTRTHSAPDCEVPSDFEGSAAEMTVFTVPACALFTRRRDRPDGPWTHTVVIPRREGALLIAQTLSGDPGSALARALARLRTMRLAPP